MDLRAFLGEQGYALFLRREGFIEVLASRGDERFVGRGATDDDADADLIRAMFPSFVARTLLERSLSAAVLPDAVVDVGTEPAPASEPTPPAQESISVTRADELAVGAPDVLDVPIASEVQAASAAEQHDDPPPPPPPPTETPQAVAPTPKPRFDVAGEVAFVDEILVEIEERLDELSVLAPEGQRLLMLLWICRARAAVERAPSGEVHSATARVAKRLSDLAKVLWPGSVRALQLGVMPSEALPRSRNSIYPRTWGEAANAVELLIADRRHFDERDGRDEDGYADADCLAPAPGDVAGVVVDVKRALAALDSTVDASKAERAAAQLRWLRGSSLPGREWGAFMGKLRQLAPKMGSEAAVLRDYLDAQFAPRTSWKELLAPEKRVPAAAPPTTRPAPPDTAALRASLPSGEGRSREALVGWLQQGLVAFDTAAFVELLRPLASEVREIADVDVFADRRARRRWREVLRGLGIVDAADDSAEAPDADADDDESTENVDVAGVEFQTLVAAVRERTAGRSAMFVSNREDPDLSRKVSQMLGLTLTWVESTPRRIDAACEKIARGGHEFVLSATGFQLHSVDASLARASRAAGIPFIRVNRGRPVACVLALARELGISGARAGRTASQFS